MCGELLGNALSDSNRLSKSYSHLDVSLKCALELLGCLYICMGQKCKLKL